MAEAIFNALGSVLTRWTMGSPAASAAPSAWRDAIGGEPDEAELRLLALSGHFLNATVMTAPQGELRSLPDLPILAMPTLPFALRSTARRVQQRWKDAGWHSKVLHFLAERGWTMHPDDWMPSAGDEWAPEVYAPWLDWAEGMIGRRAELTADTWDDHLPAERVAVLKGLRRHDPDAARVWLEAKLAGEGVELRLKLLQVLERRLSASDAPFLEGIAVSDRASTVKELARSLLARLGRSWATAEDMAERADFFEVRGNGPLPRSRLVVPREIKTVDQRSRLIILFANADFAAFARSLGFEPAELVEAWSWGTDPLTDNKLTAMASRTATDEVVAALASAIGEHAASDRPTLQALAPRLDEARRTGLAQKLLWAGGSFEEALDIGGPGCRINGAIETPAGERLLRAMAEASWRRPDDAVESALTLGLIASRTAARQALERLLAAGLHLEASSLDLIRLNVALEDRGGQG
jgi:hypothetical protein